MKDLNHKAKKGVFNSFIVVFLILLMNHELVAGANGSEFPVHSSGSLAFDVDLIQSDGPGDSTAIEIIYSVFLSKQDSIQSKEQNITTLSFNLQIHNRSGQLLRSFKESKSVSLYDSLNQNNHSTFIDIRKFSLLPDTVLFSMKIEDSVSGKKGHVSQSFKIRRFKKTFTISDLYFVSHVQRAKSPSIFEKGGVMLVPNPSRLFFVSGDAPKFFVYYEINNLTHNKGNPSFYEANSIVRDMAGNEIFKMPGKQIKVTSPNTSRINVIPIGDFSSGVYRLNMLVTDLESGKRAETGSFFQIDRGDTKKTDVLLMSEEQEKKYLDQIKYVASDLEKDIFARLNPTGKQEFLLRFWKSKDNTPATAENEFMIEHFRRYAIAENKFKGGTSSDMGRVYIMYGSPVDIERQASMTSSAQAVEIWAYAVEGRTDFVFVDRDGDGKFVLVHSTHRDEFSNPGWQNNLK